jgi:glycosyltransferase involved in cell wall biosynthesis
MDEEGAAQQQASGRRGSRRKAGYSGPEALVMPAEQSLQAKEPLRVMVMSHSHPRLTRGGAEISAYALYQGLMDVVGATAWFVGCSTRQAGIRLGSNITQPFGHGDYLYQPNVPIEHFKFANRDPEFPAAIEELVRELKPDIVHAHHYTELGVELFSIIKRARPTTTVVLSLHEYLAICNHYGQMIKTRTNRLCDRESPIDCAACFPTLAPRDFFLRKRYVQTFFEDVDMFLAPSRFLAERYVAWGLPRAKIRVLENMPPVVPALVTPAHQAAPISPDPGSTPDAGGRMRPIQIGFFGQMSPLKGIMVLIDAARELAERGVRNLEIVIYGDYSNQPPEFQEAIVAGLEKAGQNVTYQGPYDNVRVHSLMRSVDAVVVPSVWWENSPVVIQEAFANAKPVICSNIGGMAEKVRPGIDGLHFEVGRPLDLARVLQSISRQPELLTSLSTTLGRPLPIEAAVHAHMAIYNELQQIDTEP